MPSLLPDWPALEQAIRKRLAEALSGSMVRVEIEVPDTDPLAWLSARRDNVRLYCSDREDRLSIAAAGRADWRKGEVSGDPAEPLDLIQAALADLPPGCRYYGGVRFDSGRPPRGIWRSIGGYLFVLPEMELIRGEGRCCLALNLRAGEAGDDPWPRIRSALDPWTVAIQPGALPGFRIQINRPGWRGWRRRVARALEAIRAGRIRKLVLARRSSFWFARKLSPLGLLAHMIDRNRRCYHFGFLYGNHLAFLGLTPERLFLRDGDRVFSESVAGTVPRGADTQEDDEFAGQLLHSEKLRVEQQIVTDRVRASLESVGVEVTRIHGPDILRLDRLQHLITSFEGTLSTSASSADLLRALHPTPAVGGHPREAALELLRAIEPFDRGWYTGPLGWISRDSAEFAVAIRSGLIAGRRLLVYAGAGLVEGSRPEEEWEEIERKMNQFLQRISTT
ncbi:MAG TPA: isochorismate synthase [Kiritimatiellia bacterium]|nr:isochorismate synthase [Kiritimatiellia bacterium]